MINTTTLAKTKPLKRWLAQQIKNEILHGVYRRSLVLEPERQLCEKYGVSRITVKAALAQLAREKIVQKHPRQCAVIMANPPRRPGADPLMPGQILFVQSDSDPWISGITEGIRRYGGETGTEVLVFGANGSQEKFLEYLDDMPRGVTGLILIPHDNPSYRQALSRLEKKIPVVCIERFLPGTNLSSVTFDEFTGGYLATRHLIEQRHRPVYYIGYQFSSLTMEQRMLGWRAAMAEFGYGQWESFFVPIDIPEDILSLNSDNQILAGYESTQKLLDSLLPDSPWCSIFAAKDYIAQGVYRAVEQQGLSVGREVAVVGVGNIPLGSKMNPPLTSVDKPIGDLGYSAARLLHHLMQKKACRPIHQILPVNLIIRNSSLCPENTASKNNTEK